MKVVTEFPYEFVEHPDMGITMADGCRLSARVWMPVKAHQEPMPVILEHLPYRNATAPLFAINSPIRGLPDTDTYAFAQICVATVKAKA